MRLQDVQRQYAARAGAKWILVPRPFYTFEADGTPRQALLPVEEVLPELYEDETG